jgi:hypothetical protein
VKNFKQAGTQCSPYGLRIAQNTVTAVVTRGTPMTIVESIASIRAACLDFDDAGRSGGETRRGVSVRDRKPDTGCGASGRRTIDFD